MVESGLYFWGWGWSLSCTERRCGCAFGSTSRVCLDQEHLITSLELPIPCHLIRNICLNPKNKMLHRFRSKIHSLFIPGSGIRSSSLAAPEHDEQPSFPQFSQLPVELRLKIWRFALFPRLIHLHLHDYTGDDQAPILANPEDEEAEEDAEQDEEDLISRFPKRLMRITTCSDTYPCPCTFLPPRTTATIPRPPVFFACRESREATVETTVEYYSTICNKIYNQRGQAVLPPDSFRSFHPPLPDMPPDDASRTGIFMNPAIDIPVLRFNVASGISKLHHFAAIAAKEMPDIRTVVLDLNIALPPYQWSRRARFQKWRRWGAVGYWVPRNIVKFRHLNEIVLVLEGKVTQDMLPVEWRERTTFIWEAKLIGMFHRWPEEWGGKMPKLRFVTSKHDM